MVGGLRVLIEPGLPSHLKKRTGLEHRKHDASLYGEIFVKGYLSGPTKAARIKRCRCSAGWSKRKGRGYVRIVTGPRNHENAPLTIRVFWEIPLTQEHAKTALWMPYLTYRIPLIKRIS